MKNQNAYPNGKQETRPDRGMLLLLTLSGAAVFWLVSFLTSLLPLAAAYRAAFSNWSMQTVWLGAVWMGSLFSLAVNCILLRRIKKYASENPVLSALIISAILLVAALLAFDLPMLLRAGMNVLHYFFIGVMFNTVRFLLMGLSVGLLYSQLARKPKSPSESEAA